MKTKRQAMIIKMIATQNVETQEELAALLGKQGFAVTQATVSRDIKEMRLIKVLTSDGGYKYATVEKAESDLQERFIRLFSNCVLTVTAAGNMVVVKTMAGSAAVAAEAIDSLQWPEVAGSIAGDNTIFVAARKGKSVTELVKRFQKLISR